MKKILFLSTFCLLISTSVFAQVEGNYSYSIGLRGFSMMQTPKILSQTNSNEYTTTYLDGILIKFNDNQISYRLRGNYFKNNISFSNQCAACEIATGSSRDYSFTVGFEKGFNYAKIQPYFGSDFGFRATSFAGEVRNANPKSMVMPYNVDTEKNGFILSPLVGLRVSPIKEISLYVETSIDFYYSYERQETIQQDLANTRSFAKYNKWEFLLNPISIGVQIHLINKN
jgi:hypothetical protein